MTLFESLLIIFLIVLIGCLCARIKLFDDAKIEGFEVFLFKISMPCYLFGSTLNYDFSVLLNPAYIFSYLATFLLMCTIVFVCYWGNTLSEKCIRTLSASYVSSSIYTLPVIGFLFGDPKAPILGSLLQVIMIQPFFIIMLSFNKHKEKTMLRRLLTPLCTPLIFIPILGMLCNHLHYRPAAVIMNVLENLGMGVSSMALFVFGLNLGSIRLNKSLKDKKVWFLVFMKNIMHPILAFFIGYKIFHLKGYWLSSLVISTSAPTALMVYFIAKQFSTDQHLSKMVLALSSFFSITLLFFIVYFTQKI
ncbi:MAG: AEC family transporter [Gammaproteobacteria bacterium]|nr:AEC family transporter [Gammaproteobacteria bacterium]MBP9728876.1 AEC family transporter [Gammaproteobacteria bacterium]